MSGFEARIAEFERLVSVHFAFLVDEHGFERRSPRAHDLDSSRDAGVAISFEREDLRVSIDLGLAAALGLGIMIRDNRWHKRPELAHGAGPVKAVYFETLVEYLTNGAEKSIVPHYGQASTRRVNEANRRVENNLDAVLAELAAKMRAHAPRVLEGEITSEFAAAMDYYANRSR